MNARLLFTSSLFIVAACDLSSLRNRFSPQEQRREISLLCDAGGGSSGCTSASLQRLLASIAPSLRPADSVRLYGVTDDVADARELASFTATASRKRTRRALEGHQRRQSEALVASFAKAAEPLFGDRPRRASPIAASIGRALLLLTSADREVWILSDGREFSMHGSRTDFECGPIDAPEEFSRRIASLFPNDVLRGVTIRFCFAQLERVDGDRCAATIERYNALRTTWTQALESLGARVTWSTDL